MAVCFTRLSAFTGLHVFGALIWLVVVCANARARQVIRRKNYVGLQTCGMYWTFVVAFWPVLYGLVYLY